MPLPMMVPTTMAVAWETPRTRGRPGAEPESAGTSVCESRTAVPRDAAIESLSSLPDREEFRYGDGKHRGLRGGRAARA